MVPSVMLAALVAVLIPRTLPVQILIGVFVVALLFGGRIRLHSRGREFADFAPQKTEEPSDATKRRN